MCNDTELQNRTPTVDCVGEADLFVSTPLDQQLLAVIAPQKC